MKTSALNGYDTLFFNRAQVLVSTSDESYKFR